MLASRTKIGCIVDTIALLNHLADQGQKVSAVKMQFCQKEVMYLGQIIEKGVRKISKDRISAPLRLKVPNTRREIRMFLGIVGYCRQWIPNFSLTSKPMISYTKGDVTYLVQIDDEAISAFHALRE